MAVAKSTKPMTVQSILASRTSGKPLALTTEQFDLLLAEHYGSVDDVAVSPELGDHILTNYNIGNRKIRIRHAENFVQTIKDDKYENTGETVIFSKTGRLHSGQHRLIGVRDSRKTVVMDFRFGIRPEAFAKTDTGAKRLAADVISISGQVSKTYAVAAAIKVVLAWERGLPSALTSANVFDNSDIAVGFIRFKGLAHACELNSKIVNRAGFLNAASNAFCYLALLDAGEEKLSEFLGILESGVTSSKFDPPRLLREKVLDAKDDMAKNSRRAIIKKFALYIKAWKAWRAGEKLRFLTYSDKEAFPDWPGLILPAPVSLSEATMELQNRSNVPLAAPHTANAPEVAA